MNLVLFICSMVNIWMAWRVAGWVDLYRKEPALYVCGCIIGMVNAYFGVATAGTALLTMVS